MSKQKLYCVVEYTGNKKVASIIVNDCCFFLNEKLANKLLSKLIENDPDNPHYILELEVEG
jgi:hypothetical protein